jgi:hypothetical protein
MNIFEYLSLPNIIYSVTVPWLFSIYWYATECRQQPPPTQLIWHWMLCAIGTYFLSRWIVTEETRSLTGVNVFFIYLTFYLYVGQKMTASTAFVLTFLDMWIVDVCRALELIFIGEHTTSTFFIGIGGAGMFDALCIYPLFAAALVKYVEWRKK